MPPQPHRFVAVGASNLARMALALLDAERARTGGAVEFHATLGRGRSYGLRSSLLGRGLEGILDSRSWAELGTAVRPTTALLMDVGNDLLYGVPVPRIVEWVALALQRLCGHADRRLVVGLPIAAIRRLSNWRFVAVRSVLVPSCKLTLAQAIDGCEQLHEALAQASSRHQATFHAPPPEWYGFDPVHVHRRSWRDAARAWLGAPAASAANRCDTLPERIAMLLRAPVERRWFGVRTTRSQPCRRWRDGSTLSLW